MPCPLTFLSLGFVFGKVSKIKVTFVTFFMIDVTHSRVETEFGLLSLILIFL